MPLESRRQPVCSCGELIFERLDFCLKRKGLDVPRFAFDLEPIDDVALSSEFGELVGGPLLELLDVDLETPRRHRELGAKQILVGLDFGHRLRNGTFQAPHGQAHGTVVDERSDGYPDEGCKKEADPEIHDRFDHLRSSSLAGTGIPHKLRKLLGRSRSGVTRTVVLRRGTYSSSVYKPCV